MNFDLLTVVAVVVLFILLGRENKKGRPHFPHVGCFQTDVELAYRVYPPHMGPFGFRDVFLHFAKNVPTFYRGISKLWVQILQRAWAEPTPH